MLRNRDIIIVGLQPWDIEIGSNCKNIAAEFARHNRVLYVNPPIDVNTRIKHRARPYLVKRLEMIKNGTNLVELQKNFWNLYPANMIWSINWLPHSPVFNLLNKRNNRRFAKDIKKAIRQLGFKDYILFNDSDMMRSFYLEELLKPSLSIYYSRDNLMSQHYFYKHGHTLEPALMKKSSLVTANSTYLAGLAAKHNPQSFYVGQGCDLSVFNTTKQRTIPADIAAIPRPIIGYIGAILSYRLSLDLLLELCRDKPEWSFVFIGKADEAFEQSALKTYSNVYFLGLKDESILPDYLAAFDVAMNPQAINEMTIGNYPRKVDEYLAMGKPVVATETETMRAFVPYVYLGKTAADYARLIEQALAEDNAEKQQQRISFAQTHTWENSAKAIYESIEKVTANR